MTPLEAYGVSLQTAQPERKRLRHCAGCQHVSAKHLLDYQATDWKKATLKQCEVRGCPCTQWVEGERY